MLIEKSWKYGQEENALDSNQPVHGAQNIVECLRKFDLKVQRNEHYKVST